MHFCLPQYGCFFGGSQDANFLHVLLTWCPVVVRGSILAMPIGMMMRRMVLMMMNDDDPQGPSCPVLTGTRTPRSRNGCPPHSSIMYRSHAHGHEWVMRGPTALDELQPCAFTRMIITIMIIVIVIIIITITIITLLYIYIYIYISAPCWCWACFDSSGKASPSSSGASQIHMPAKGPRNSGSGRELRQRLPREQKPETARRKS